MSHTSAPVWYIYAPVWRTIAPMLNTGASVWRTTAPLQYTSATVGGRTGATVWFTSASMRCAGMSPTDTQNWCPCCGSTLIYKYSKIQIEKRRDNKMQCVNVCTFLERLWSWNVLCTYVYMHLWTSRDILGTADVNSFSVHAHDQRKINHLNLWNKIFYWPSV